MKTSDLLKAIETAFEKKLDEKTGWGRNEIKTAYRSSVNDVLLLMADRTIKKG